MTATHHTTETVTQEVEQLSPDSLISGGMLTLGTAIVFGVWVARNTPLKRYFSGKIAGSLVSKKTLGLGVFALLTGGIFLITQELKPASSTMEHGGHDMSHDEMMAVDGSFNPTPVTVEVVKPKLLEASVEYTGSIEPYQVVTVYPRVAGQLTDYSVYPGDRVTTGQILAQLSANELLTKVSEAQAEADTRRTALDVSQMEVLEQKNAIEQVEADLTYLNKKLGRFAMLVAEGAIAQDDYDVVESEVQSKQATLAEAKVKLARLEAKVVSDRAKIQQSKAKVATASVMSSYTEIKSPISGIVQERIVDPGMVVQPGMGILKIGDYNRLRIQSSVAQQDAINIRLGSPIIAKIPGSNRTIKGQVTSIFPQANSQTRTVKVEAVVENSGGQLLSGQFVEMEIITQRQPEALSVPQTAIINYKDNPAVWVVEGKTARRKQVKLGMVSGDRIHIAQGLRASEAVITTGHHKLLDGAAVAVVNRETETLTAIPKTSQDRVDIKLVSPPRVKIGDAQFAFDIRDGKTQKIPDINDIEITATMPMKNMAPMISEVEVKADHQKGLIVGDTFMGMKGKWIVSVRIKEPENQGKKEFEIEVF